MNETIADRIKLMRIARNMSQADLAERAGYSDKTAISKLEHSGDKITNKQINRVADALRTDALYLSGSNSTTVNISKKLREIIPDEHSFESLCIFNGISKVLAQELLKNTETTVSLETLSRIASHCEITMAELLRDTDPVLSDTAYLELTAREHDIVYRDVYLFEYLDTLGYHKISDDPINIKVGKSGEIMELTTHSLHTLKRILSGVIDNFFDTLEED